MKTSSDTRFGRPAMLAVSAIVLVTLMLQGLASFGITFGPIERSPFMWPFLNYPMYDQPRYAGDAIERQVVIGILADSSEVVVAPADVSVDYWQVQRVLNPAILRGDESGADFFRQAFEERHGRLLLGFRLEDHSLILTEDGLEESPPTVLGSVSFRPDPGTL